MTRLTDERLEEIAKGNGGFLELAMMARELILLRREVKAAREVVRVEDLAANGGGCDTDEYDEAHDTYKAARKATDEAGYGV